MIPILKSSDAAALKARVMERSQLQNDDIAARVKEIVSLDFGPERTPLSCRNSPRFHEYFDHIWKELGVHE